MDGAGLGCVDDIVRGRQGERWDEEREREERKRERERK